MPDNPTNPRGLSATGSHPGELSERVKALALLWQNHWRGPAIGLRQCGHRKGGYALATQKALPKAVQVADRWHLMENASRAFLDAVRKSMRQIRTAIGATTINPALLTAAEKLQYEGYLRREETNAAILAMAKNGATIKEIVRRTGYGRGLTRKVLTKDSYHKEFIGDRELVVLPGEERAGNYGVVDRGVHRAPLTKWR
jgi:hypothetical protein